MLKKIVSIVFVGVLAFNTSIANQNKTVEAVNVQQSEVVHGIIEIVLIGRNNTNLNVIQDNVTIELINDSNEVVFSELVNEGNLTIDTSNLPLGTYSLVAKTASGTQTETIELQ